jgi:lysophospholipase L1-like esterase
VGNFAVSGTRTDQFNVDAALATGASIIGLDGPVNDFAQNYPSAGTTVATTFANLKAHIKKINAAGAVAFYTWERGAANFTSAQIGYVNDFNALMADFVQYGDGSGPPWMIIEDPSASTLVTSSNGTIALQNSADGTHDNIVGAQKRALALYPKFAPHLRELPGHRLRSLNMAKSGLGSRSIIQQAGFTGSVAAAGTGNSGNVPTNCSASQSGLATGVYSIQATSADADGNTWGNEQKIVCTATGAGSVNFVMTLDKTNIVTGDVIRGGCEIDVAAGATGLSGVSANLEWFPSTGGTTPTYDMIPGGVGTDPGGYAGFPLEPPPLPIGVFTGNPFTNLTVRVAFTAAGSATVIIRKPWAVRSTVNGQNVT